MIKTLSNEGVEEELNKIKKNEGGPIDEIAIITL